MLSINGSSCKQIGLQVPGPNTLIGITLLSLGLPGSLPLDSTSNSEKLAKNILAAIDNLSSGEGTKPRIVLSMAELIEKTKKEKKETGNLQKAFVSLLHDLTARGYPVVVLESISR